MIQGKKKKDEWKFGPAESNCIFVNFKSLLVILHTTVNSQSLEKCFYYLTEKHSCPGPTGLLHRNPSIF